MKRDVRENQETKYLLMRYKKIRKNIHNRINLHIFDHRFYRIFNFKFIKISRSTM